MDAYRGTARIVGAYFLIAMVASLNGGVWLDSILNVPDYLTTVSASETQVILGVLLELINVFAVLGIAVMMFPVLKMFNENIARGYFSFRIIEASVLITAVIGPLSLVALSQEYLNAGPADASFYQTTGA